MALMPPFIEYFNYCFEMVDRLEQNPGDDYTSELIKQLAEEKPAGIDKVTIVIALFGLLMAGHETTTNQSSLGLRALLTQRESWEALCADPKLIPNAVEEIIRYDSSVIAWRRVTNKEVELHGMKIPKESIGSGPSAICPLVMASTIAWARHWLVWSLQFSWKNSLAGCPACGSEPSRIINIHPTHPIAACERCGVSGIVFNE